MPEKSLNDLPRELRMLYTKGNDALQRENFDYAIAMFTQVLTSEPRVYECRKALRTAQLKKAGTAGRGFFKRAFSGASSSPLVAKGQLALRKDPMEAIQIAEQILASDGRSASGHKLLAEAALAVEMPQTAILSLEILVSDAPNDKELNLELAEALAMSGNKGKAEQVLMTLKHAHPNDNEIHMALKNISARRTLADQGYEALASGEGSYRDILKDKQEAISLEQEKRAVKTEDVADRLIREYEARLKTEPHNLKLLRDLGDLYLQKHQHDQAVEYYEKINATDGGNDASLQRKIAETKIRKYDHAIAQLDQNAPDYAEKVEQIKADRTAFQLAECQQRAERYPTDLQIRFELGQLYYEGGKITEAIGEFQKAKNNPQRSISSKYYLAQCYSRRGMNDMAARGLQDALKEKQVFDSEKKELIYALGCVLEKMGKKEEAIEQFKLIYEVDIGYKDVSKKVDDYYAAS